MVSNHPDGAALAVDAPMSATTDSKASSPSQRKFSKLLKGKYSEKRPFVRKDGPLQLLDLPLDILNEIVKEVTHTNDLTALALTHSALHYLAIPHIYSRFDIVWPDATSSTDSRTGVDALTYGLSTLVMGHDVFRPRSFCPHSPASTCSGCWAQSADKRKFPRRLGNNYSQFTRKFSLGNGPADWVQEYMISKESGKMLGTLVALAIARMVNLETFVWDMPTGVLRDVWLALSSLQDKSPPDGCRLDRVLVRWHDNSTIESVSTPPGTANAPTPTPINPTAGSILTEVGLSLPPDTPTPGLQNSQYIDVVNRVEFPTLSVLPPLKSLSVLDVDELAYLDEMSILIGRSKDKLRELRVGISKKASNKVFVYTWDCPGLKQVDHDAKWSGAPNMIGQARLGGVLGIIVGRIFDIRKKPRLSPQSKLDPVNPLAGPASQSIPVLPPDTTLDPNQTETNNEDSMGIEELPSPNGTEAPISLDEDIPDDAEYHDEQNFFLPISSDPESLQSQQLHHLTSVFAEPRQLIRSSGKVVLEKESVQERPLLNGKLRLQVLELERVPLSIYVLQRAFDWTVITSLTILDCAYHENLWKMLRRHFQPHVAPKSGLASSSHVRQRTPINSATKIAQNGLMEYQLNLKKIHTDFATPALIGFLKETLAPNSLEVLFLQDRRKTSANAVSINDIYRGPLRRHRRSLRKLLIDSSDKLPKTSVTPADSSRWRTWMLNHTVLTYITSGNMSNLRELSVAIEYRDWHYFLRRLPQIPTLRSLNIPFIADHVTANYDPKELALQVVDVIFLRPEVELCYLGISHKCFEILENKVTDEPSGGSDHSGGGDTGNGDSFTTDSEDEDDEDDDDDDEDDDEESPSEDEGGTATEVVEGNSPEYEPSEVADSEIASLDGSDDEKSRLSLKLREILFYDDKVEIFKARHMRLSP